MSEHTDKTRELKSLAADLCDHCSQDCRLRLAIMDSQIEALRTLIDEFGGKLATLESALDQFRALYQINMRFINLINAPGEEAGSVN